MQDLIAYGADQRRFQEAAQWSEGTLARVVAQYGSLYSLVSGEGECLGEVSGRFRFDAAEPSDYPCVGDFVLAEWGAERAVIRRLLSRRSVFSRRAAGQDGETQLIAANVELVFLCLSLNGNYSLNRLERYLSVAFSSGAAPVVVLTKADLCDALPAVLAEVSAAAPGVEIVLSDPERDCARLRQLLLPNRTAAFIGSSGVGKSTLINRLAGTPLLETGEIRRDGKGRHTTTRRELLVLPAGGVVIDTPGMRELGADTVDLRRSFADIDALAARCRFADCAHGREPGCAVRAAIAAGELTERRLESWRKLKREARYDGLSARELETEKAEEMFKDVGGRKNMRKFVRANDKRKGK